MERVLDRLQALDPGALPLLGKELPLWAGIVLAVVGLTFAVAGSRPPLRPAVAALAGAGAGWFLAPEAVRALGWSFAQAPWVGAVALGLAGLLRTQVLAFVAGGVGAALAALSFWPGELLRAGLPALLVGGLASAVLHRALLSLAAAAMGASLAVVGGIAILLRTPVAASVTAYPVVAFAVAGLLFICAAAYQLTRAGEGKKAGGGPEMPALKRRPG